MNKLKTWLYVFRKSSTDFLYYHDILKANFWFSLKYLLVLLFFVALIPTVRFAVSMVNVISKVDSFT